jgi:hypothetical protein
LIAGILLMWIASTPGNSLSAVRFETRSTPTKQQPHPPMRPSSSRPRRPRSRSELDIIERNY